MENALENIERGIRDALQRLSDVRARLATHSSALDEKRLVLVRSVSPLLLQYPAESAPLIPSCSRGAADMLPTSLLSHQSVKSAITVSHSLHRDGLPCEDNDAEDVEDTIIISPAAASSVAAAAAAAAREQAPAPSALHPLPLISSALALPQTSTCDGLYSAMVARTHELEEQCFHYHRGYMVHAAKLQIAQAWIRDVQPWFENVVYRGFCQRVLRRLDVLDQRVRRLCLRLSLDRHQYIPSCQCTTPIRRHKRAQGEMVDEERHPSVSQGDSQWRFCCARGWCNRGQTNGLRGVKGQTPSDSDRGGEKQATQQCGCLGETMCLPVPPSQQGCTSDAVAKLDGTEGNHNPMCFRWRQYIEMLSQPVTPGDEHLQSGEENHNTLSPILVLSAPLLRTPRSLRHVWHVIMEGLTSSDMAAASDSVTAEPPTVLPAAVGDATAQPGRRLYHRGHIDMLVHNLSDLVRRCPSPRLPLPAQQLTLPFSNYEEHEHERDDPDIRDDPSGDKTPYATAGWQARLPLDTGSPAVDLLPSHLCVLLCCAMQLCSLAKLCNVIRADPSLPYVTPPPPLVHDADVGDFADDDSVADDGFDSVKVVQLRPREPIPVLARATHDHRICQRTREGQIAVALAAVYHTLPCMLLQLSLAIQTQRCGPPDSRDVPQKRNGETDAAEVDDTTAPKLYASPAEEDRSHVVKSRANTAPGKYATTDAALWPTVGDAARDRDAFVRWWWSLVSPLFTTELSPSSTSLTEVPSVYARALRVGSLFRTLLHVVEGECGERPPSPGTRALPAELAPTSPTSLTTTRADPSALAVHDIHGEQHNTTAVYGAAHAVPASSPPLAATTRLSSLREVELQTRQQWQSIETSLSVARSMVAEAFKRTACNDGGVSDLVGVRTPMQLA
ncbi:hypothetical protein, conserved [Leishmania tarentolae]|uniref:Uncharacterized protein n=1 Tax=Leishmania tarentolae TaxID=5689 RepID=A0A640KJR5_LEITA|nr:hypothetical protein, conserved [Leishmania tarentolae]